MSNAEILCIGTELLLGDVLNTNAHYLSQELAKLGVNCFFHTTVGDNKARIKECLANALARTTIVITSGGLGPTADDLTIECIAELFEAELIMDESILSRIEGFFRERGLEMPRSNAKQALRPEGADLLPNPTGTAPGIIWRIREKQLESAGIRSIPELVGEERLIITFPGVPYELKRMWEDTATPLLLQRTGGATIYSKELKHFGIGESALAEKFSDLLNGNNPTVAPYAGNGECRLRVTAKAADLQSARNLVDPVIEEIKKRSGVLLYGYDDDTLESVVGEMLKERGMTIASAESCTGGLLSKRLTDIPGSSEYIALNVVTYANSAKENMLAIDPQLLEKHGAVSKECAEAMARGIRSLAKADIAIGITGVAGPGGGTPEKPVGLVYIGLAAGGQVECRELRLPSRLSRKEIRHRTVNEALNLVRLYLLTQCKTAAH